MIKVLFVCLGNICRSPMAEFVFKYMVQQKGLATQFFIDSAGTEYTSEDHSPIHYGTKNILAENIILVVFKQVIMLISIILLPWKTGISIKLRNFSDRIQSIKFIACLILATILAIFVIRGTPVILKKVTGISTKVAKHFWII